MNNFINRPTSAFIAASWVALLAGAVGFMIGLWNADITMSEKGFYIMSFLLSLFGVVATQKNIRDLNYLRLQNELNPRQLKLEDSPQQDHQQD